MKRWAVIVKRYLLCSAFILAGQSASAMCFEDAGVKYKVNASLLRGIAVVESSMNPTAMNYNNHGSSTSYDIGLMQINSGWLKTLAKFGITEKTLKADPCMNVMVGAWILASNMQRMGENWNAVGAYNAACSSLKGEACTNARNKYVTKVWNAMNRPAKGSRQLNQDASQYATQYAAQHAAQIAAARQAEFDARMREAEGRKRLTRIEISNSMVYSGQALGPGNGPVNDLSDAKVQKVSYVAPSRQQSEPSEAGDQ